MKIHRRTKPDEAEWKRIRAERDAGVPMKLIADRHQLSRDTIIRRLKGERVR